MFIAAMIIGYLIGSFPSAYVAGRWFAGLDITQHGSGNVGGTNTLRILGPLPGMLVIFVDVSKGIVAMLLAQRLLGTAMLVTLAAALGAVVGHNWSLYLKFRGGKGIAVTVGITGYLFWQAIWPVLLLAVLIGVFTRYVSLASLTYTLLVPAAVLLRGYAMPFVLFAATLTVIAFWRHRGNVRRLMTASEPKLSIGKRNKKEHD